MCCLFFNIKIRRSNLNGENQINYYAIIPFTVRYDNELKSAEKLLYGEITAYNW